MLRRKFTACKMRSNLLCTEVAGASFLDACGEQETQRTKMHGGPVRVIYRDDDGVIPRKAGKRCKKLSFEAKCRKPGSQIMHQNVLEYGFSTF